MNREKLFTINFIVQAVVTTVAQIVNLVQKIKNPKADDSNDSAAES